MSAAVALGPSTTSVGPTLLPSRGPALAPAARPRPGPAALPGLFCTRRCQGQGRFHF